MSSIIEHRKKEAELNKTDQKKYKKLLHGVGRSISEYGLISENDRIMVAVSGGKDSIGLLYLLLDIRRRAPITFELFAYTLDQAQPGFDTSKLEEFYRSLKVEYYIEKEDTYSIVLDKIEPRKTYCSLCSRLRRGILYSKKDEYKANKLALGHHADDAMETLMLNILYSGRLAAISPKLCSDDKNHIVIRPLIETDELGLKWLAKIMDFPIIPCNLCGNQENLQRQRIKKWLQEEQNINPVVRGSFKSALKKVEPRHLW